MSVRTSPTPPATDARLTRRSVFFARNRSRADRLKLWRVLAFCAAAPVTALWIVGLFINGACDWGYGNAVGLRSGSVFCEWPSAAWVTVQQNAAQPPAQPTIGFATGWFRPDFDFVSVSIKSGGPNSVSVGILAVAGVLYAVAGVLHYRITRLRLHAGLCQACFYDRSGLDAEAPCPECGTLPHPRSAVPSPDA